MLGLKSFTVVVWNILDHQLIISTQCGMSVIVIQCRVGIEYLVVFMVHCYEIDAETRVCTGTYTIIENNVIFIH